MTGDINISNEETEREMISLKLRNSWEKGQSHLCKTSLKVPLDTIIMSINIMQR